MNHTNTWDEPLNRTEQHEPHKIWDEPLNRTEQIEPHKNMG